MKEYIDKEKAIEAIRLTYCKDCNNYNGVRCRACEFDDAMMEIEDCPTADVVEVVRCKDCKYWKGEKTADPVANYHYGDCTHEEWRDAEGWDKTTCGHEYCSRGERKEQK